jgi:hypothetical protein
MRKKVILALDLGTKTGWATRPTGSGVVTHGVQDFSRKRGESLGMIYLRFGKWLREMVEAVTPEVIIYETPHHRGGWATEITVGFSTRVHEVCASCKIEHMGVHSGTLKKFWVGRGRCSKEDMMEECRKRGFETYEDNEADAIALFHLGEEEV